MKRVLHYGGTFDPIHYGHFRCARAVAQVAGFGEVVLVPGWRSPHKVEGSHPASAVDRLAMCKLAANCDPVFNTDDIEIRRGGTSYTIDTIRALKTAGFPEVHWLIGADQLLSLPRWREPEALIAEATFHIMLRPGYDIDWSILPTWLSPLRRNVVNIPQIDISATMIRGLVRNGQPVDEFVPEPVARYIESHGLYRDEPRRP